MPAAVRMMAIVEQAADLESGGDGTRYPDSDRSSKFGRYAIISRICTRVTTSVFMVENVAD